MLQSFAERARTQHGARVTWALGEHESIPTHSIARFFKHNKQVAPWRFWAPRSRSSSPRMHLRHVAFATRFQPALV